MKIEVGKTYLDSDGDKVEIIRKLKGRNGGTFLGIANMEKQGREVSLEYKEDGTITDDYSGENLVKEVRNYPDALIYVPNSVLDQEWGEMRGYKTSKYTHIDESRYTKFRMVQVED